MVKWVWASAEYSGDVEHPDRLMLNTLTGEIEQGDREECTLPNRDRVFDLSRGLNKRGYFKASQLNGVYTKARFTHA